MSGFRPTAHPVLGLPTAAEMMAMGTHKWQEAMVRRESIIKQERADPLRMGWEPPIWKVCDALLCLPWVEPAWGERMRRRLGFDKPVSTLLINGGNRAGKSQYAANRTMRLLRMGRRSERSEAQMRAWVLHSTLQMSRDYQQPLLYNYLPNDLRGKDIKSRDTYIAYKQKTGFSEEKFVLPPPKPGYPGADCLFKAYEQDRTGIEGGNLDWIWPDELVPVDWVETMELRIAEKNGWMVITFTPVEGYTPTVALFQSGAQVVMESVAYLLPKDGGEPDVAAALGLTEAELAEVRAAEKEGRASASPQCVPEACANWIEDVMREGVKREEDGRPISRSGGQSSLFVNVTKSQGLTPPSSGREWEMVPRVMKCADGEGKRAVVFFHSADNPYGNPKSVISTISGKPRAFVLERFYGVASKQFVTRFPKFAREVHVIAPEAVPAKGTNYQIVDPSSGRNFFMVWFRVTPEQVYAYREWPGPHYIPGIGVPGPWALPDGKKPDGRPGPAQNTFGWGLLDYKRQIAELEGWAGKGEIKQISRLGGQSSLFVNDTNRQGLTPPSSTPPSSGDPTSMTSEELIALEESGEGVQERFLDSRFASNPRLENDRPTTLLTDFEDIGLFFTPTPGGPISEGVQKINDLLNYDPEKPVDFFNRPKLLISSACPNLIFALATWTGKDGERGATKDPIDCLHYFATADCTYLGGGEDGEEEGRRYY